MASSRGGTQDGSRMTTSPSQSNNGDARCILPHLTNTHVRLPCHAQLQPNNMSDTFQWSVSWQSSVSSHSSVVCVSKQSSVTNIASNKQSCSSCITSRSSTASITSDEQFSYASNNPLSNANNKLLSNASNMSKSSDALLSGLPCLQRRAKYLPMRLFYNILCLVFSCAKTCRLSASSLIALPLVILLCLSNNAFAISNDNSHLSAHKKTSQQNLLPVRKNIYDVNRNIDGPHQRSDAAEMELLVNNLRDSSASSSGLNSFDFNMKQNRFDNQVVESDPSHNELDTLQSNRISSQDAILESSNFVVNSRGTRQSGIPGHLKPSTIKGNRSELKDKKKNKTHKNHRNNNRTKKNKNKRRREFVLSALKSHNSLPSKPMVSPADLNLQWNEFRNTWEPIPGNRRVVRPDLQSAQFQQPHDSVLYRNGGLVSTATGYGVDLPVLPHVTVDVHNKKYAHASNLNRFSSQTSSGRAHREHDEVQPISKTEQHFGPADPLINSVNANYEVDYNTYVDPNSRSRRGQERGPKNRHQFHHLANSTSPSETSNESLKKHPRKHRLQNENRKNKVSRSPYWSKRNNLFHSKEHDIFYDQSVLDENKSESDFINPFDEEMQVSGTDAVQHKASLTHSGVHYDNRFSRANHYSYTVINSTVGTPHEDGHRDNTNKPIQPYNRERTQKDTSQQILRHKIKNATSRTMRPFTSLDAMNKVNSANDVSGSTVNQSYMSTENARSFESKFTKHPSPVNFSTFSGAKPRFASTTSHDSRMLSTPNTFASWSRLSSDGPNQSRVDDRGQAASASRRHKEVKTSSKHLSRSSSGHKHNGGKGAGQPTARDGDMASKSDDRTRLESSSSSPTKKRPNIILFMTDDLDVELGKSDS